MDPEIARQAREEEEQSLSLDGTKCGHCGLEPLPCPFCGKPGKIYGQNMVGCSDSVNCGATIDFGHWCGTDDDGTPAEHFVLEQWNKRVGLPSRG